MGKRIVVSTLLLLVCAGPAKAVDPDELNLITFQNRTGVTIQYLFLSPGDSRHWSTDILGSSRVLRDDDELSFYIHYPERCNDFDIYAIGDNDQAFLLYDYEICDDEEAKVRISRRDLSDSAPDFDFATVTIENGTDYDMWYVFFSPGDSSMWGVDQLDSETILEPGDSFSVLLPVSDESVRYDVRAVDEDEDTYTFYVEIDNDRDNYSFEIEMSDLD